MDTEDQEGDSSHFHNGHGQLGRVLSDVGEGPGGSFLDGGVELFEADHEGFKCPRVNHCFSELSGVLGDCSEDEGCCFLVESLDRGRVTFCSLRDITSCGRISLFTTLSASSSFMLASLPRARAALWEMEGTLSSRRGRRRLITPADWRASMFWGRVASSATVCTKVTLA